MLVVSLERVKQAVLSELGLADAWSGSISIFLHPVYGDQDPVRMALIRHTDKWAYRLELPEVIDRQLLLRAVTEALLLEIANRRAGTRQAEMPPWLPDGLAAHLTATSLGSLALEPHTNLQRDGRKRDPLLRPRECLRTNTPLSFNELTLPAPDSPVALGSEIYRCCAQLFVSELLRLKDGRACLVSMLGLLPEHLNWQTAFLRAFQTHFQQLLDVDKWWSLNVVHLTGQDPFSIWSRTESWNRLEEALRVPVEVRGRTNDLPALSVVNLQTVVSQWEPAKQAPLLRQKVQHLHALRYRMPPDIADITARYCQALESHLEKAGLLGEESKRWHEPFPKLTSTRRETVKRLDELNKEQTQLRRQPAISEQVTNSTPTSTPPAVP